VRRFARAYVQGIARFRTDKRWALDMYRKYAETDDPGILDELYAEFGRCVPGAPSVSEAGLARMLVDLAKDEPRLAGRQATDFVDSRFLRELEASGFLPEAMSETR
jgi:hypothetical protein